MKAYWLAAVGMLSFSASASEEGVFLGVKGGYQISDDQAYKDSDPKGGVVGLFTGYQFSDAWSVDFGYQYHAPLKASLTDVEVKTSLFESAVMYDWYFTQSFSLYGRLGAAYWMLDKETPTAKVSGSGFSPFAEVGAHYRLTPNMKLGLGYQYIDGIGENSTGQYDTHIVNLNLSYRFGSGHQ